MGFPPTTPVYPARFIIDRRILNSPAKMKRDGFMLQQLTGVQVYGHSTWSGLLWWKTGVLTTHGWKRRAWIRSNETTLIQGCWQWLDEEV